MLQRFVISPPFGNYRIFDFARADRIAGSFTFLSRPGRLGQIIRTVRPIPGGWVNSIGLRNPGIQNHALDLDLIYSLAAIGPHDWRYLAEYLCTRPAVMQRGMRIELNLSCPNVFQLGITAAELRAFTDHPSQFSDVVVKLSPDIEMALRQADICGQGGITNLHIGNAYSSPAGGISGQPLLAITPRVIEEIAKRFPQFVLTAGGGISRPAHIKTYRDMGALRFSISTGCLHPLRISRLIRADILNHPL